MYGHIRIKTFRSISDVLQSRLGVRPKNVCAIEYVSSSFITLYCTPSQTAGWLLAVPTWEWRLASMDMSGTFQSGMHNARSHQCREISGTNTCHVATF